MRIIEIFGMILLLLLGGGILLYDLAALGTGLMSMVEHDTIRLLPYLSKAAEWPLGIAGALLFMVKIISVLLFAAGLAAFGLYLGLRSEAMYPPAIGGLVIGLAGDIITEQLIRNFLLSRKAFTHSIALLSGTLCTIPEKFFLFLN